MSLRISEFAYKCNICLGEVRGTKLPQGWLVDAAEDGSKAFHFCDECRFCFGFWQDSRRQARREQAKPVPGPKPKTLPRKKVKK